MLRGGNYRKWGNEVVMDIGFWHLVLAVMLGTLGARLIATFVSFLCEGDKYDGDGDDDAA